jgi:hypothetical protein
MRQSNTSKHELLKNFLLLWVIFALLDPDPDSKSGSGSATLVKNAALIVAPGAGERSRAAPAQAAVRRKDEAAGASQPGGLGHEGQAVLLRRRYQGELHRVEDIPQRPNNK